MQTTNPVVWFEIYVNDINRARRFYETVLNLKLSELPMPETDGFKMLAFPGGPEGAGSTGALVHMNGVEPGGNSTVVYFRSDDCSIEEARVEAAGGKIMKPKESIGPYGFISLVYDPDGNVIGLHSMA